MATNISGEAKIHNQNFDPFSNNLKQPAVKDVDIISTEENKASAIIEEKRVNNSSKLEATAEEQLVKNEANAKKIDEAIATVAEFMSLPIRSVNFTQDDGTDKTIIKVFDSENKELIKQFPSEEVLAIAQKIVDLRQDVDSKAGILLDESV
jgi:flagellar protein FlaG